MTIAVPACPVGRAADRPRSVVHLTLVPQLIVSANSRDGHSRPFKRVCSHPYSYTLAFSPDEILCSGIVAFVLAHHPGNLEQVPIVLIRCRAVSPITVRTAKGNWVPTPPSDIATARKTYLCMFDHYGKFGLARIAVNGRFRPQDVNS